MTSTSNVVGSPPPVPSPPPSTICPHTTNEDVKLWVYRRLRKVDAYITEDEAWALARSVIGDGQAILSYNIEEWEKELPRHGHAIYFALQNFKKYVLSERQDFIKILSNHFIF